MAEKKNPKDKTVIVFGEMNIRREWDDENEKWWFSVVDVIKVLTDSAKPRDYWYRLKVRVEEESGFQLSTICRQLKLLSPNGKKYEADVSDQEGILRIIQSIPSKKAEPFKRWLAQVGSERLDQIADPEKSIQQALADYRRLGYSEDWINQRLKSIEIRKDLTDAWGKHGVSGQQYASLTDIIYKTWAGKTAKEYKAHKGLKKENLRDNMTNGELLMNMLAEYSTTSITNSKNPQTYQENKNCAVEGGNVAKTAREQLEAKTGEKIVSELNASEIRRQKIPEGKIDDKPNYKNNIAMLRRMRGFSQVYMAEKLGVARQTYINIEKGLKELTLSQVEILKEVLGVSFDDLLATTSDSKEFNYKKFLE
ncbi:helix-turn-helix domain-containing protein [Candidatus Saccharibacteria bacterium]|nr:helix-turn-helix domain-containing protein [Candidatus Saccharibacteria bacterium]